MNPVAKLQQDILLNIALKMGTGSWSIVIVNGVLDIDSEYLNINTGNSIFKCSCCAVNWTD